MSAIELLNRLRRSGIAVTVVGERLAVDAPQGALTPALRDELVQRKAELLSFLRETQSLGAGPAFAVQRLADDSETPLSHAQQRLWFLDQLAPQGAAYVMSTATLLRGRLDAEALRRALSALVARHDALRTIFGERDGVPFQRVLPPSPLDLAAEDLRACEPEERRSRVDAAVLRNSREPFDLAVGPLLRARLLRLGDDEWLLLLAVHHIVFDAWSGGVFVSELAQCYAAERNGAPLNLPPVASRYCDFVVAQRRWLESGASESLADYWRSQLGGELEPLRLPTRATSPSGVTGMVSSKLHAAAARALRELAKESGASLSMVLLAAFEVLLHRLTGQNDVVVGTPAAGRDHPASQRLVGYFVNTLVLRMRVDGAETFQSLLARVRDTSLAAYAHQEMPFDAIVNALGVDRNAARTPIFQVFFNHLSMDLPPLELADLEAKPFGEPVLESKFDLTLYVREVRDEVELLAVFDDGLFAAETVQEWLSAYASLAEQAARGPERAVAEFSLLTGAAAARLPDACAPLARSAEAPRSLALPDLSAFGARVALRGCDEDWTYAELDDLANRLAGELVRRQLGRGAVVALLARRAPSLVAAMLGVLRAGAAFAVLDPAYPDRRLAECWRAAGSTALLRVADAPLPGGALEELARDAYAFHVTRETLRSLPRTDAEALPQVMADDVAYVAFTSGTTGGVKAVTGRHGPVDHFLAWQRRTFGLGGEHRFAMLAGLAHDPLLRDVFAPLSVGAGLHVPGESVFDDPTTAGSWFAEHRIDVVHLTPALAEWLAGIEHAGAFGSVRLAFFGGEALTPATLQRWIAVAPNARNVNFYGATETPQAMAFHIVQPDDIHPGRTVPIGKGIDGVQLLVVNSAAEQAGVGELGEIVVRTPYLTAGYRGDAAATEQRFVANPLTGDPSDTAYRTGDLGRYRYNGDVEFAGRSDEQVKLRGFRIELREVESALNAHPAVRDAAAAVVGDRLVAYIVGTASPEECRDHIRSRLPAYMVPSQYHVLGALPRTPNNKIDRRALVGLTGGEAAVSAFVAPRSTTEATLASIWADVLGLQRVGANDNFFDVGGHSLLATRVLSRVSKAFGVRLRVRDVFAMPTLVDLARHIETVQWISRGEPVELLDSDTELEEESF